MSDKGENGKGFGVSRRDLLYGLATAGVGAGIGTATAATMQDRESFDGNLYASGQQDLQLCWDGNGNGCTPEDGDSVDLGPVEKKGDGGKGVIRLKLPDSTSNNNPAWVWFRTSCPDDPCGLEEKLDVKIWYDDCEGSIVVPDDDADAVIANGSLCEVLKSLHEDPVLLDGDRSSGSTQTSTTTSTASGDKDPLGVGEELCLGVKWELTASLANPDTANIDFEFHATQERYASPGETSKPESWEGETCDVDCECDSTSDSSQKAISFVAFCGINEDDLKEVKTVDSKNDNPAEPLAIRWTAVDGRSISPTVILKAGNQFEEFTFQNKKEGIVRIGEGSSPTGYNPIPRNPCPPETNTGFKYENPDNDKDWGEES